MKGCYSFKKGQQEQNKLTSKVNQSFLALFKGRGTREIIDIKKMHYFQCIIARTPLQLIDDLVELGELPEYITRLTSIEQHHVENAPTALEAIENYFQFIEDTKSGGWIGHHVSFDTLVIKKQLQRVKYSYEEPTSFDTIDLIDYLNPSWDQLDLKEYAQLFGLPLFERHRARCTDNGSFIC